ncbi:Cys-tRNA(Pro) deacylase [Listeria ivanovii]|uniref:Cys-tRNA(Pro)/Cys-tRNA(Cys) deacylase n=1 Tax=Listeria ivanovii (strain ATCC BAA-678 / PAM 55) TaxID=881621 RepID=G2ZD92_LISIP|nr:Cys-tRNA(Pro) deacylase [Listeria ivanovii]AHI55294.1 cysteinyl-tRNA(Pro) deacylase [Listeria ivanovii WSLC3009]AIS64748.1 cysteinyl-tRNA(Pro) deacylase [Listeria ivanovii subsp. ivanovii]MBC1758550.1 Cys-tRNA(Pro) deacylase [Listeria ivanovii]MBK3913424.1 Cys-tRNA(Pro) deacylase [Listeria ivanovii subsp. ivanovii]MBK3920458.1 Cys-tRNA(Pro) deacylase [Listeria ivanovii subsp. ivanovii]
MNKTNVCRKLEQQKISYELLEYTWNEDSLDAIHVALETGDSPSHIFKTIVLKGDKTGNIVACIPADKSIDLKRIAKISGNKRCELVPVSTLEKLTGYVRGGCSPIGMKKLFPTFIDSSAESIEKILISAGKRGLQILIAPMDLKQVVRGTLAAITEN